MLLTPPKPLRPWMRKAVKEAAAQGGRAEEKILASLSELSESHHAWVATKFKLDDKVSVLQHDKEIKFPRPLHKENHRTILRGYLESLHGKYQIPGFCEVEQGDIVVDCGAYVGGFARSVAPQASRVVLIEPAPDNYACCEFNMRDFSYASVHQMGLFNESKDFELQLSRSDVDHSFLSPDRGATGQSITVPARRLDDLATDLNLDRIDFLKLEAEGAEIEAIDGMGALRPAKIAIDAGPERYGESPAPELTSTLESYGYTVQVHGHSLFAVR